MSGRRPAVYKNHPIVEDATRAGEPDSAGRLPQRRDVNPAVIGVSLAETAETPTRDGLSLRRRAAMVLGSQPNVQLAINGGDDGG